MRTESRDRRARRVRAAGLSCAFATAAAVAGVLAHRWFAADDDAASGGRAVSETFRELDQRTVAAVKAMAADASDTRSSVEATAFSETRPTTGSIRVRVVRNGKALDALALTLRPGFGPDPDLATRRAATNEQGEILFEALLPGAYSVLPDYGAAKPVEVKLDAEALVELTVGGGFDVEGEVVDDGEGKPVPFAEIYLDGGRRMSRVPTMRADAEGRFRLVGLPVGYVSLCAVGASRNRAWATVLGGERDVVRARIVCGSVAGDVEVVCVDESGKPMSEAAVVLELGSDGSESWGAHASCLDAAGAAHIPGLTAGRVFVRGKTADGLVADGNAEVVAGATARVELVFRRAIRLSGVVVSDDGETPVADADLELVNWDQFCMSDLTRKTEKDGSFAFPPFLTREGVALYARHPQLGNASEELSSDACVGEVVVRLKLDARRILRVRLLDAEDAAVTDAPIYVKQIRDDGGDGDCVQWVTTGADGRAAVFDLPPDVRHRVGVGPFAGKRGWFTGSCETETWAAAPEAQLRLERFEPATCVVRGRLIGTDDRPLRSVAVHFGHRTDPQGFAPMAVTDADGSFESRGIAPGEITPRLDDVRTGLLFFESRFLLAGEAWDLGDRRVGEPGTVAFVRSADGVAPRCTLFFDYGGLPGGGEWLTFDGNGRAERLLAAGTYRPTFGCEFESSRGALALGDGARAEEFGIGGAGLLTFLHVAASETREVVLPTMATRSRFVTASVAANEDGTSPWVTVYVALFESGQWQLAEHGQAWGDDERRFLSVLGLPRGKHLVNVSTGGRSATTEVVVSDDEASSWIAFDLRS
jgi:hypothetical protein